MINAIAHRDYSQRSASITLAIFDDRMEIWNNGLLPKELKIENLEKKHRSYPRNKLMANVFYARRYMEEWGTGTVKMFELCREHGIPDPIFEEYLGGVSVQFMFAEPIQRIESASIKQITVEDLSRRQQEIIHILEQSKKLKSSEIMERLTNPSLLDRTFRKDLTALKKLGIINSRGRGRNTVWFKV